MSNRPTFKEAKMQTKKEKRAHTAQIQILDVTRDRDGEARARARDTWGCEREAKLELTQGNSYFK